MAAARENPQAAHEALRKGLEALGQKIVKEIFSEPNGMSCVYIIWIYTYILHTHTQLSRSLSLSLSLTHTHTHT